MQQIICDRDNTEMTQLFQCKVQGTPVFRFQCSGCGGIANVLPNGQQVHLNGNVNEYRPNGIRPGEAVDMRMLPQPAYSLGSGMSAQHRQAYSAARGAYNGYAQQQQQQQQHPGYQLQQPVAYTLGRHPQPVQPLPHDQLRRRIMGIS